MTNEQIIYEASKELAREGKIKPSEEIHTFAAWKSMGYIVRKGEKAVTALQVWKFKEGKEDKDGKKQDDKMFLKVSHFFARSQVEALA